MGQDRKIELLAPAGSYQGFEAALGAGADAVYVGGTRFGARAYARNFSDEELLQAIDTAHIYGKKLYLTVNTLLKNKELYEELIPYLQPFYQAGLDGVIIQDFGVFTALKEAFPLLHLHASTQMAVTGPKGMRFLEQQGAARVVAARELTLKELERMHKESSLEIEAFVHGALCYSYSGQCLMSSVLGGRSGNRGRCAQPCRLPYDTSLDGRKNFKGKGQMCPLSLKDICTIEILPEILDAGVTSLKIEGRMKQPEYTAGVTAVYRKYLDLLEKNGKESYQVEEKDRKYLLDLFNRGGSCTGYYKMQGGPSMMAFSNEKKTGEVSQNLRKRKEKIYGNLILFPGSPVILEITCQGKKVTVSGGEVQYARNNPMAQERIRQQMEKVGNTPFVWGDLKIQMEDSIFVPMSALNQIRRDALTKLQEELLKPYRRSLTGMLPSASADRQKSILHAPGISVSCEDRDTAQALWETGGFQSMYLPFDLMELFLDKGVRAGISMYLALPYITRGQMPDIVKEKIPVWLAKGMKGFLVRNLESYAMLSEMGYGEKCRIDHTLYTWNNQAVDFWRAQKVLGNTVPLELNQGELGHRDNQGSEMLVYGYLPLMYSAQCVRRNVYSCKKTACTQQKIKKDRADVYLKDRYENLFPVVCECDPWKTGNTEKILPCYNIIYNTLPFGLLKESRQVKNLGIDSVRLSFTMESPGEAVHILKDFTAAYRDGQDVPDRKFTKGHFKRGAQ